MAGGSKPKNAELVYFIEGVTSRLIKIGVARDAMRRLCALQVGSPDKLSLLGIVRSDDPCRLEGRLHSMFRRDHSHGEWFHPSAALVEYIWRRAVDAQLDEEWGAKAAAMNYVYRTDPVGFWDRQKPPRKAYTHRQPRLPTAPPPRPPSSRLSMRETLRAYKEARGIA